MVSKEFVLEMLLRICILLVPIVALLPTASLAGQGSDVKSGFYQTVDVVFGFENSKALDRVNDASQPVFDEIVEDLIEAGDLPQGSTGTATIEVGVMPGIALAVGYRFIPQVALEGEFEWARGDVDMVVRIDEPGDGSQKFSDQVADYSYFQLGMNGRFSTGTGRIQPYALLGVGFMGQKLSIPGESDEFDVGAAFRLGGGVEVEITRRLSLASDFSYLITVGGVKDNDIMSLRAGLLWRY
jgi:opacity protein-like surface antigen